MRLSCYILFAIACAASPFPGRITFAQEPTPAIPAAQETVTGQTTATGQPAQASPPTHVAPPAQTAPVTEPAVTPERIELLRKQAEESSDLDEERKKKAAELCRSALAEVQRGGELATRAAKCKLDADSIQQRVDEIRQQIDKLKGKEPVKSAATTLPEFEQALSKHDLELVALKKAQSETEAEPKARAARRKEIRARLLAIPDRLAELRKQIESPPAEEPQLMLTVRRAELRARQAALQSEVTSLESELAKYDAEEAADFVRLQRDLRAQEVALAERQLKLIEEQIQNQRAKLAQKAVVQARDEVIGAEPVLKSYAQRNRELAETSQSITELLDAADKELKQANETREQLAHQFKQTKKKVETVGLTSSIGALLRKQRASLPNVRKWRSSVSLRREVIDEAQFELFDYDDERAELANPEPLVQAIVREGMVRRAQNPEMLEAAARELLDRKREYLDSLIRNYNKYFDTLVELDTVEHQIITQAREYEQYIDERVLWIRSGNLLTKEMQFDPTDAWFISGDRWAEVPRTLYADARLSPVPYFIALLLFSVLFWRGKRFRRELREIGDAAQSPTFRQFMPTLRALLMVVAIAALWPGLVGFVAWRLNAAAGGETFAKAVGEGLACLGVIWFPLELMRQICRPSGLGVAHFAWPESAAKLLRGNLRWLILLGLPLAFITTTFVATDPTHGRDAVERTCFILGTIVLAWFLRRVLRPYRGVFHEYIAYHQGGWIDRLKHVWYWIGVVSPLALAALTFWGYYYTAQALAWRLYATLCFVVTLVVVRAMLLRLILVRRRKLSIAAARERSANASRTSESSTHLRPASIVAEQAQPNLSAHSAQTQRLLATGTFAAALIGFWMIWVQVLPALSMLDRWPLWTTTDTVEVAAETSMPVAVTGANAAPSSEAETDPTPLEESDSESRTKTRESPVTFSHLALSILIVVITFVSARNVPGLLEMSILQRLPLDASVRYAITSLTSYTIILIGVIVACSNLGLRWSQIQWLATALTFGLAFGLQEMFANFVAGIIILFERPIRVGDVVTVDDVTGVVSRIRIRATCITNWDRKEYVVPNKEFITGRLLNWTLSDKINRIVINVGIAYGSDTQAARDLLLKVANDHPLVLKDPPPIAAFEGFGDSCLNFCLRTFLPTMENRLQVIHELHTAIDLAFRDAGIEIAFPQRDLHIRSTPAALALALGNRDELSDDARQSAA